MREFVERRGKELARDVLAHIHRHDRIDERQNAGALVHAVFRSLGGLIDRIDAGLVLGAFRHPVVKDARHQIRHFNLSAVLVAACPGLGAGRGVVDHLRIVLDLDVEGNGLRVAAAGSEEPSPDLGGIQNALQLSIGQRPFRQSGVCPSLCRGVPVDGENEHRLAVARDGLRFRGGKA